MSSIDDFLASVNAEVDAANKVAADAEGLAERLGDTTNVVDPAARLLTEASAALAEAERQVADHTELKRQLEASEETRQRMAVEASELRRSVEVLGHDVDVARRELEDFKNRITNRLHEQADENNWCDDFDDQMEEFGLDRREREKEAEITATITIKFRVSEQTTLSIGDFCESWDDTSKVRHYLRDNAVISEEYTESWSVDSVDDVEEAS